MLTLRRPSPVELLRLAADRAAQPLSAPAGLIAGVDADRRPGGWFADESTCDLGRGDDVWAAARVAVNEWAFYDQGWLDLYRPSRIAVGELAAMIVRIGPGWSTNWCRITEVIETPTQHGFVYATLHDHAETGEERFLVERDDDGRVTWRLTAVSRPGRWYTFAGQPIVRLLQARFRRGAATAMKTAIAVGQSAVG